MSFITREPKTFNNCLVFERGLWQHQMRYFAGVSKSVGGVRNMGGMIGGLMGYQKSDPSGYPLALARPNKPLPPTESCDQPANTQEGTPSALFINLVLVG
jgi:hypothetical protein